MPELTLCYFWMWLCFLKWGGIGIAIILSLPTLIMKFRNGGMERDKVSAEDFEKINVVQMDNKYKKILADVVIDTDKPCNVLRAELVYVIDRIKQC